MPSAGCGSGTRFPTRRRPLSGPSAHCESICKPDSVTCRSWQCRADTTTIHLGELSPVRSSGLPGIFNGPLIPAWPCSRWGLQAVPVARGTGGLLHHLFTLACVRRPSAVRFLLHFPSGCPAWELPSTVPCGVRTFLDAALERHAAAARRTRRQYDGQPRRGPVVFPQRWAFSTSTPAAVPITRATSAPKARAPTPGSSPAAMDVKPIAK